ncbi:unnamed protein product [Victoria cruziana]
MTYTKRSRHSVKRSLCTCSSLVLGLFLFSSSVVALFFLAVVLPDANFNINSSLSLEGLRFRKRLEVNGLGLLGEEMVKMLGTDLPFTVFIPSEQAFEEILKLQGNASDDKQTASEKEAILSRLLGFSAVPRQLLSVDISSSQELCLYSISGCRLDVTKVSTGVLLVNNVRSKLVDLRRGEVIVHLINGVIMDAEFEQAVRPVDEDD